MKRRRGHYDSAWNVPAACEHVLDDEGRVRGKTWRQMPGGNGTTKAINWWLWKRGILDLEEEQAQAEVMETVLMG